VPLKAPSLVALPVRGRPDPHGVGSRTTELSAERDGIKLVVSQRRWACAVIEVIRSQDPPAELVSAEADEAREAAARFLREQSKVVQGQLTFSFAPVFAAPQVH
jgi:hypothetical protein